MAGANNAGTGWLHLKRGGRNAGQARVGCAFEPSKPGKAGRSVAEVAAQKVYDISRLRQLQEMAKDDSLADAKTPTGQSQRDEFQQRR